MPKKPQSLHMIPSKKRRYTKTVIGFVLALFGILHCVFWETTFNRLLEKALTLRPNTKLYDLWKAPPIKLNVDFYLYNWTNPEQFHDLSIKPKVEQLGPYRFTERPEKLDIRWHPENASVSYRKRSHFQFDAEGSSGTLNDRVVTLNSLAVSVSNKAKRWNSMRRTIIDIALKVYRHDLTLKKSVRELLFEGYEDMLLDVANIIPSTISDIIVPFDKFGYCYPRNNSDIYGVFNMYTGAGDISKFGKLHTWNHRTSTKFFPPECAHIQGSAGEFQPPPLKVNETIEYFLPDFCRPVVLDYDTTVEVEGVTGFKYKGGLRSVDNGTLYPENACYCNGECVPSGLINVSSCWYEAPIFMSYPHFYNADPYYLSQLDGMNPTKDQHELSIVLDPRTGLVMEVVARYQANLLVEPNSHLSMFRNARKMFFPLFWFEQTARITPDLAVNLKMVPIFIVGGKLFGVLCVLVGILLIAWHPLMQHLNSRILHHIEISDLEKEQPRIGGGKLARHDIASHTRSSSLERAKSGNSLLPEASTTECDNSTTSEISSTNRSDISLNAG